MSLDELPGSTSMADAIERALLDTIEEEQYQAGSLLETLSLFLTEMTLGPVSMGKACEAQKLISDYFRAAEIRKMGDADAK